MTNAFFFIIQLKHDECVEERSGEERFFRACLEALVVRVRYFRLGNVKEFDRQYFYMKMLAHSL